MNKYYALINQILSFVIMHILEFFCINTGQNIIFFLSWKTIYLHPFSYMKRCEVKIETCITITGRHDL